jgi:thioredoxin-like negative regulator of GroEL
MDPVAPLIGIAALLALATALGLLLRKRKGRVRDVADAERINPAIFELERFGESGAIVQFSTEFCARCPGVKRLLTELVAGRPGLKFVHVDLTHDAGFAKRFHVLQTPTVLFIDTHGHPIKRLSGQLGHDTIRGAFDGFAPTPGPAPASSPAAPEGAPA